MNRGQVCVVWAETQQQLHMTCRSKRTPIYICYFTVMYHLFFLFLREINKEMHKLHENATPPNRGHRLPATDHEKEKKKPNPNFNGDNGHHRIIKLMNNISPKKNMLHKKTATVLKIAKEKEM
jgi:hypothetical protein